MATKGRKRNRKKSFWVTEGEWKAIEKIAAGIGMGIGEYLRISALGKTIYQIEELKPVLHELKCISRNLNQLTMLSHQGVVRTVNLTATADGIGRCYEAINRLYADTDAVIPYGTVPARQDDLYGRLLPPHSRERRVLADLICKAEESLRRDASRSTVYPWRFPSP